MERNPQDLPAEPIVIRYRNYKGQTDYRTILPVKMFFGTTKFHQTPQWLLTAKDIDKGELRDFAVSSILEWAHKFEVIGSTDVPVTSGRCSFTASAPIDNKEIK